MAGFSSDFSAGASAFFAGAFLAAGFLAGAFLAAGVSAFSAGASSAFASVAGFSSEATSAESASWASSSLSHSASGSASCSPPEWRATMPSAAASAITLVKSSIERIASSLPGIPIFTSSGSQLVSKIAITGIPSFLASVTARCSLLVSTTQIALGVRVMFLIPPRLRFSLSRSRRNNSNSFLV